VKEVLSYLLALGGLGLMLTAFAAASGKRKYLEARTMVRHLLATQPNRAELVCRAQKGTFGEAVAAAMKTAAMCKTTDINVLVLATKPAYDATAPMVKMFWDTKIKRVRMAGAVSVGAVALAIAAGASPILHILLALASIAAGVYVILFKLDVDRSLVLARLEILPEVERAFAEGRYGFLS
jgi:Na+/proline symporter